jgi:hypothetical protein
MYHYSHFTNKEIETELNSKFIEIKMEKAKGCTDLYVFWHLWLDLPPEKHLISWFKNQRQN